jgi:hypothetical protein
MPQSSRIQLRNSSPWRVNHKTLSVIIPEPIEQLSQLPDVLLLLLGKLKLEASTVIGDAVLNKVNMIVTSKVRFMSISF